MAVSARKTLIGKRSTKGRKRPTASRRSTSRQSHLKRARTPKQVKHRGAKISRSGVRSLRDDLDRTQASVGDLHENFWVMSEQDIRQMLAKTQEKIGRAVDVLEQAA
jgi:DNA-binding XRE family transcriptional regulator